MTMTTPAWFAELQEAAQAEYESLPMPTRKIESWRFGNIKQLDFEGFTPEDQTNITLSIPDLPCPVLSTACNQAANHSTTC